MTETSRQASAHGHAALGSLSDGWLGYLAPLAGSAQECIYSKSEELIEYVPEALKNLLLVMASRGILTEQWRVRVCHLEVSVTSHTVRVATCPCA